MFIQSLLLFYTFGVFLESNVSGSVIVFSARPATVIEGLTEHTTLRCSLNDTASSASVIGRRDVTRTIDNVEQVSSIIVTQNGVDVASVSQSHAAKCLVGATNIHVAGDVTQKGGERGFLELSLQYPTPSQVGEYQCEVSAVSSSGHGVIFTTNAEINTSLPTIDNLVDEINNAKILEKHQRDLITTLQQTVASQQNYISSLQSNTTSLQQQVNVLQAHEDFETASGLQVRLLGGDRRSYGAVQLRYNLQTGMLCDDFFDSNNNGATVVCRMLGFKNGTYEDGNHFFALTAYTMTTFLLDHVQCAGSEADLTHCSHNAWGREGVCGDAELAGVRCS